MLEDESQNASDDMSDVSLASDAMCIDNIEEYYENNGEYEEEDEDEEYINMDPSSEEESEEEEPGATRRGVMDLVRTTRAMQLWSFLEPVQNRLNTFRDLMERTRSAREGIVRVNLIVENDYRNELENARLEVSVLIQGQRRLLLREFNIPENQIDTRLDMLERLRQEYDILAAEFRSYNAAIVRMRSIAFEAQQIELEGQQYIGRPEAQDDGLNLDLSFERLHRILNPQRPNLGSIRSAGGINLHEYQPITDIQGPVVPEPDPDAGPDRLTRLQWSDLEEKIQEQLAAWQQTAPGRRQL